MEIIFSKEVSSVEQKLWCYACKISSPDLAQVSKCPSNLKRRSRKIPKTLKIGAFGGIWELENNASSWRLPELKLETTDWIAQSRGQTRMWLKLRMSAVHVSAEVKATGYGPRGLRCPKATTSLIRNETTDISITPFGAVRCCARRVAARTANKSQMFLP